jgi:segregation and condensation protein A
MKEQQKTEKNNFKLQKFEGPLDLLLFLIQKSEVNIYDIPISEITEQYLAYLQYNTKIDLNNLTDFYAMAATLIYIKSKMLLPVEVDFDEDFEDPRRELVDRLIEYQKFKKYAELIAEKESELDYVFSRKKAQNLLPFDDANLWEEINAWDLLKTFSGILSNFAPEKVINMYEEVSVNEKIALMHELFENSIEISFVDLVVRKNSPMDIICAFLAILEAVKIRMIKIYQNTIFGDIRIAKRDDVNTLYNGNLERLEEGTAL